MLRATSSGLVRTAPLYVLIPSWEPTARNLCTDSTVQRTLDRLGVTTTVCRTSLGPWMSAYTTRSKSVDSRQHGFQHVTLVIECPGFVTCSIRRFRASHP